MPGITCATQPCVAAVTRLWAVLGATVSLTAKQITDFHRDGVIRVRVFTPADLQPVKDELTRVIDARACEFLAQGKIRELYRDQPFARRAALLAADYPKTVAGFDIDTIVSQPLFDHVRAAKMLDVVESLLGSEISLNPIHHVRVKPPSRGTDDEQAGYSNVPWHQDSGVTTVDSDRSLILTCWRPIGPATEAMGCMQVIPGVHNGGHLRHIIGTTIDPVLMPKVQPVPMVCDEGDVVIMSQFTPHHSTPNRSPDCRWSIDVRYHVTGQPSGRDWQPATVLRSRAQPETEVTQASVWAEAWQRAKTSGADKGTQHRIEPAGVMA